MFVLVRKISPYSGSALLLGVFRSAARAEEQRSRYLQGVVHSGNDPWAQQAYHEVTDGDVTTVEPPAPDLPTPSQHVYVVSAYAEAFGQVVRTFEGLFDTHSAAEAFGLELEAKNDEPFAFGYGTALVPIDELSPDPNGYPDLETDDFE
ncbi:MAG: hypothetical protein KC776_02630 [Myxococcales bacterium]|nr:hypothetical protein [Myxococcales bacterium]MCB9581180.1 hypothetical protein [Polyangiaceae bacterium]